MTSDDTTALLPPPAPAPTVAVDPVLPIAAGDPAGRRSLAPDLARGMLLLFIASANVWGYLWSAGGKVNEIGYRAAGGSTLDHAVDGLVSFLVDDRSRPMFAILYGFGLATMAARLAARGADRGRVRRVLAKRSGWLIALGIVHSALLFGGDILAPYGMTGLVALAFLHRSRRTMLWWFAAGSFLSIAAGVAILAIGGLGEAVEPPASWVPAMIERLQGTVLGIGASAVLLFFVPQVVIGILLARSGWLTRPWDHRRRLGQVVVVGFVVNLVGNLPYALGVAQVWHPDRATNGVLEIAHYLSGVVMGLAYVCLFAWVAAVWRDRSSRVIEAVAAVGERSLTCYLLQSVMFAPLLSAWGLGLGGRIGTAQAALLAVGVWAVTVGIALAMHRAGRRGPFEVLLRRLTYGRRAAAPLALPVRA